MDQASTSERERPRNVSVRASTGTRGFLFVGGNVLEDALQLSVNKDLAALAVLNLEVEPFLEQHHVPSRQQYVVRLVLEELFTNIVKFTRQEPYSDTVRCRVEIGPGAILLTLEYEGPRFDPREAPSPNLDLPLEQRPLGGLGIHLVRNMVDYLEYARESDTNRLDMRIGIPPT